MKRIREQSFRESRNTSFRHTQRRDYNFLKDFIEVHIRRLHIHVFSSSLFVWQISGNISVLLFRALCILRRFLGKEYIALYHVSYSIITHSSFSNSRIRPSKKYRSIASWSSSMATTCYVNNIERRFFSRFPNSFKSDWPRAFFFFWRVSNFRHRGNLSATMEIGENTYIGKLELAIYFHEIQRIEEKRQDEDGQMPDI